MQFADAHVRRKQPCSRTSIIAGAKMIPQSKIGKMPVQLPKGVDIKLQEGSLTVKGPKGELSMAIHPLVTVSHEDGVVKVVRNEDTKKAAAMHGMSRAICANLVHGVSEGFTKELDMRGIGYRATINGQQLSLTLGFSHPVVFDLPEGVSASTRPNPDPKVSNSMVITLQGASKEQVGTIAAAIRAKRPPEPYKGKGIRYLDERIILKAGKSGKKA